MRVVIEKAEVGWYESASGEIVDDLLEFLEALPAGTKIAVSVDGDLDLDEEDSDDDDLFNDDSDTSFV